MKYMSNLDRLSYSCKTTNKQNGLFFYLETVSVSYLYVPVYLYFLPFYPDSLTVYVDTFTFLRPFFGCILMCVVLSV